VRAIKRVWAGEVWLDPTLIAQLIAGISGHRAPQDTPPDAEAPKIARLTRREREVIELIGAGLHNHEIAERLSISEVTVSHHLTSVFGKLGLANRFDLVVYAYRHGLAQPAR
jgi:DNA-binding NarL/FixJ family response regulator